jgi:hypothetical protein
MSQGAITKGWTSESGMPGEGLDTPGYGHKEEPNGRALPPTAPYLHQRTHPDAVAGCFACRVATVGVALAPHASTRGDGIDLASDLKVEHQAIAARSGGRIQPVGSRWV